MSPLTEQAPPHGDIMIVDDNPANLTLLENMLRQHGYDVRSFPGGRLALAAAEKKPPELLLLDVNMPEMNGYEVCGRLKSSALLSGIPVIFISALYETEDKLKGFHSGGVDYISKPFQFEEVHARIDTHLKLRRAQRVEHELLEKTLGGAVGTVWELVQLSSPVLARRSQAIRDIVLSITTRMGIKDPWCYDLAATLCLVGCMALPDKVFDRAYCGQDLLPEEDRMFRAHPERAASLLSNIPRLEVVAEMIRLQQIPDPESSPTGQQVRQGARMLHLALELDRRIYRGMTCDSALAELKLSRRFDGPMLTTLESYSPPRAEFLVRRVPIRELRPGMVIEKDIVSKEGNLLILKEGTVLTETWLERLENFSKARGTQELIDVQMPRTDGAPRVSGHGIPDPRVQKTS